MQAADLAGAQVQIQTVAALLGLAVLARLALVVGAPVPILDLLHRAVRRTLDPAAGTIASSRASEPLEDDVSGHAASPAIAAIRAPIGRPVRRPAPPGAGRDDADLAHLSPPPFSADVPGDLRPATLARVRRIAIWGFLIAAITIVAATDLWTDRKGPILAVLLAAAIATMVFHWLVRGHLPENALLAVEGGTGLIFAGMLIALTGGALSPFSFTLGLIVVGAAVVVSPGVALALTAVAGAVYLAAIAVASGGTPVETSVLAVTTAGITLAALCLVGYVGVAIGREQRRAREDAHRLATIDPLTGLRTRPSLFAALERELARSRRTGRSFCLLMIDLDDLKAINDRLGHIVGDRALRLVGDVIGNGIRQIDTGARFGGDEFVVLLPETDPTGGWVLAEKIRQGVAEGGLMADGLRVPTSVSVGLVTYPDDGETVGTLLARADAAMYDSKRAGRDRVTGVPVMDTDASLAGHPGRPV